MSNNSAHRYYRVLSFHGSHQTLDRWNVRYRPHPEVEGTYLVCDARDPSIVYYYWPQSKKYRIQGTSAVMQCGPPSKFLSEVAGYIKPGTR